MAAIILKQANPGYIEGESLGTGALDKAVDAYRTRYNKYPLQGSQWFKTEEAKGGVFKIETYGQTLELPRENLDADQIPFATPVKGFSKSFTVVNYRLGIQIERRFKEDQLMAVADKMASGLVQAGRLHTEYAFADVINNATTATKTGADGVALAANNHPQERRATGTWSNLETAAALTHGTFSTARKNMRKRTDEFGYPQPIKPQQLVVPAELEQKAKEIFASERVDDNALNTKNVWKDSVDIFIYDYMTSTTAWMLWGDRPKEFCGLHYVRSVPMSIVPTEGADKSTDIIDGRRLRHRFVVGFSTERNLQYNAGA